MKYVISLVFGILISLHAFGLSAHRNENESYAEARARAFTQHYLNHPHRVLSPDHSETPEDISTALNKVNLSLITAVTKEQLQDIFYYIRDTRFMNDGKNQRRLSWLYPDDGCFARAAMSSYKLKGYPTSHKVFIFGNLQVKTPNTKNGMVSWWYHVAVAYRVDQQVYIIDPSINPYEPMTINDWGLSMVSNLNAAQFSVCHQNTYDPSSSCSGQNPHSEQSAYNDQLYYLGLEWSRLQKLNRNPEKELGDEPPWQNQFLTSF